MSEAIQKVLTNNLMGLPESAKAIGRQNIGAQASGDYAYNSALSAKQDSSAMSGYLPYSAISADADSAITSINGSSVGKFTGVSAGNNITGNGTSSSPLGLSGKVGLESHWGTAGSTAEYDGDGFGITGDNPLSESYYRGGEWKLTTKGDSTHWHYLGVSGGTSIYLNYNSNYYINRLTPSSMTLTDEWYPARYTAQYALGGVTLCDSANSATLNTAALTFSDSSGTAQVDRTSIDKWNSGSWSESANSIGTGFGGNPAVSASQYNYDSYSNWACREVVADGIPAHQLYGFQSIPGTQGKYNINESGVFVPVDLPTFCLKVYKPTDAIKYLSTADYPAMPATADGLLILVNLGNGPSVVYPNSFGATAAIAQNNSAQLIWDHSTDAWVRLNT